MISMPIMAVAQALSDRFLYPANPVAGASTPGDFVSQPESCIPDFAVTALLLLVAVSDPGGLHFHRFNPRSVNILKNRYTLLSQG